MRHEFEPTRFHVTIGEHEPVLRVADGDTIATWCVDAGGYDAREEQITQGGNPQTGPFYVEEAEPGDTLAVRLDRLRPNRRRGVTGEVVEVTVRVLKGTTIGWPRAEDDELVTAVGNARPLDQALQHATTELMRCLGDDYGLGHRASSVLLGQLIRYDVGNVFDPAYTMVAKIAKRHLPQQAA